MDTIFPFLGGTDLQVRSAVSLEEEEVESGDENEEGDSKIDADAKDKQPLKVHGSDCMLCKRCPLLCSLSQRTMD